MVVGYCSGMTRHWKECTRSSWHWIINHILVQMTHKYVSLISDKRSWVPRKLSHLLNIMPQSIHGLHSIRTCYPPIYLKEYQYTRWRVQGQNTPLDALRYLLKILLKSSHPTWYFVWCTCQWEFEQCKLRHFVQWEVETVYQIGHEQMLLWTTIHLASPRGIILSNFLQH